MRHSACSFIRQHPLSLTEVIAASMIVRGNVPGSEAPPFPRLAIAARRSDIVHYYRTLCE